MDLQNLALWGVLVGYKVGVDDGLKVAEDKTIRRKLLEDFAKEIGYTADLGELDDIKY